MLNTVHKTLSFAICFLGVLSAAHSQQLLQERLYFVGNTARSLNLSALTPDGNIILTGGFGVNTGTQSLIALVKPNTDTIWVKRGPLTGGALGIIPSLSGGYAFYSTKRYISPNGAGPVLQKYSKNGSLMWTKAYPMGYYEVGKKVITAPDSGYFLAGSSTINTKDREFVLSRTDSAGNLKWKKSYDWDSHDFFSDLQHTFNNNIIMYGQGGFPQRLKLIMVNHNGDSIIGRKLTVVGDPTRNERVSADYCGVTSLSDGGFIMAAELDTTINTSLRHLGMVVKVNANLQPVWHYINHSHPHNVAFTRSRELVDGSVLMLGHVINNNSFANYLGNKFCIYRFSSTGLLMNIYTFTSNIAIQVRANALEVLPDSSIIISGFGTISTQNYGIYIAKVGIPGLPPAHPLPIPVVMGNRESLGRITAGLGQNFPNPTAEKTTIPYQLSNGMKAGEIVVRDIFGRVVTQYTLNAKQGYITVDTRTLANGLYTYTLYADYKPLATKKLTVVK